MILNNVAIEGRRFEPHGTKFTPISLPTHGLT